MPLVLSFLEIRFLVLFLSSALNLLLSVPLITGVGEIGSAISSINSWYKDRQYFLLLPANGKDTKA